MANHLQSEPESIERGFEMVRSIDEKRGLLVRLSFAEFTEKQHVRSIERA